MIRTVALAFLVGCAAAPVAAQIPRGCDRYEAVVQQLRDRYHEVVVGYGLDSRGLVVTIFVSSEGSWTAVIRRPDGLGCVAASGQGWTFVEEPWPPVGDAG